MHMLSSYIFLSLLVIFAGSTVALLILKKRNAWDILFLNSTLAIVALFMIGILAKDLKTWQMIVIVLGFIATGEKIVGFFVRK